MAHVTTRVRSHRQGIVSFAVLCVLGLSGCADFGSGVPPPPDDGGNNGGDTATVFFASQVLPIFEANCGGNACHIPCRPTNGGGMCLVSHATLTSAGVVIAGDAESSLLVQYLDGRQSPRMPNGRLPLADSLIQRIRTWIDEGALDN